MLGIDSARETPRETGRAREFLALLLMLPVGGCSRPLDPEVEEGAAWTNMMRAGVIELITHDPELDRVATRTAARWELDGPLEVVHRRRIPDERAADPRGARVVVGGSRDHEARELAERLGFLDPEQADPEQPDPEHEREFVVGGRRFDDAADCLVATFVDPQRAGLPVTLIYSESAVSSSLILDRLWPGVRCELVVFQHGRLAARARLEPDGTLIESSLRRLEPAWAEEADDYRLFTRPGVDLRARAAPEVLPIRAGDYLDVLGRVRAEIATWTGVPPPEMSVILESSVDRHAEQGAAGRVNELARYNPVSRTLIALLAAGLADDAGALAAEVSLRAAWGEPVQEWMASAAGCDVAGRWWGRSLEDCGAALELLDTQPSFEEVFAGNPSDFVSPHLRQPVQALLFRALRKSVSRETLARLWRGEEELELQTLKDLFRSTLATIDPSARDRVIAARSAHLGHAIDPERSLFGFHLRAPADATFAGFGSRPAHFALNRIQKLGAEAIAVPSLFAGTSGPWHGSAWNAAPRMGALEGDAALAVTLAEARARGFSTVLSPELLTSPAGGLYGEAHLTSVEDWQEFFAAYEHFITHYALFAELLGVDILCIGSGMPAATRVATPAKAGARAESEASYTVRREGWARIIRRARQLFGGALTFGAEGELQASEIAFWDALDWVGIELEPSLLAPGHRSRRGDRLRSRVETILVNSFERIAQDHGRPFLVTRIGFRSAEGAALGGGEALGAADPMMQARLYDALADALDSSERAGCAPRGLLLRAWSLSGSGAGERGFVPQDKPAESVVGRILRRP
jgi:hypothetical protein